MIDERDASDLLGEVGERRDVILIKGLRADDGNVIWNVFDGRIATGGGYDDLLELIGVDGHAEHDARQRQKRAMRDPGFEDATHRRRQRLRMRSAIM